MRCVLDTNILVSALLSRNGSPAELIRHWRQGNFELVVSPALLIELERVLAYPKITRYLDGDHATAFLQLLRQDATLIADKPPAEGLRSEDPDDDYLIALARNAQAYLISGDKHLLRLAPGLPVQTAAGMLLMIATE